MTVILNRKKIPNIILVGSTSSGKTSIAYLLSKALGFGFLDVDTEIEKLTRRKNAEFFESQGEALFREKESEVIRHTFGIVNHVIALGAGALETATNYQNIKNLGPMVWISTPTFEIVKRLVNNISELEKRPRLKLALKIQDSSERAKFLTEIINEDLVNRQEMYGKADLYVDNIYMTPEACSQIIKQKLITWSTYSGTAVN